MKPEILKFNDIENLKKFHPELLIDDQINLAFEELFDIEYPEKKDIKLKEEVTEFTKNLAVDGQDNWGNWVYFNYLNRLVHFPPLKEHRALRTSRNRNLINIEEQAKLYDSSILIVGMSVGSNIVEALVSQGIGGKLILVDMDTLEPSNLNRIRSPYYHVGLHKVEAISRKVWEIDPYIEITAVNEGLNEENLKKIINEQSPQIIIDEMDELRMKIILREQAKAAKIPVIMAADDGDDALLDIERYDINPNLSIFSGSIPAEILEQIKNNEIPRPQLGMMIGKFFVGPKNIPLRMYESLSEVGKTLPSWPQLGGAAALSGIAIAYVSKKIILRKKINEGRILISLDEKIDLDRLDEIHIKELKNYQQMLEG